MPCMGAGMGLKKMMKQETIAYCICRYLVPQGNFYGLRRYSDKDLPSICQKLAIYSVLVNSLLYSSVLMQPLAFASSLSEMNCLQLMITVFLIGAIITTGSTKVEEKNLCKCC